MYPTCQLLQLVCLNVLQKEKSMHIYVSNLPTATVGLSLNWVCYSVDLVFPPFYVHRLRSWFKPICLTQ